MNQWQAQLVSSNPYFLQETLDGSAGQAMAAHRASTWQSEIESTSCSSSTCAVSVGSCRWVRSLSGVICWGKPTLPSKVNRSPADPQPRQDTQFLLEERWAVGADWRTPCITSGYTAFGSPSSLSSSDFKVRETVSFVCPVSVAGVRLCCDAVLGCLEIVWSCVSCLLVPHSVTWPFELWLLRT